MNLLEIFGFKLRILLVINWYKAVDLNSKKLYYILLLLLTIQLRISISIR